MKETLKSFKGLISSMDIDDKFIYTTIGDTIHVWDKKSNACVNTLEGLKKSTRLTVDGQYIYCASLYHFTVLDKKKLEPVYEAQFGKDVSSDLGWPINDEAFVYFPIRNGRLVIIDKADFEKAKIVQEHTGTIWGMDFDKEYLYTASTDKTVMIWEKEKFKVIQVLTGHKSNVQRVRVNDKYILSGSTDLSVIIWDKKSRGMLHRIVKAHSYAINGLRFWKDTFLSSSQAERKVRIWELDTWKMRKELDMSINEGGGMIIDKNAAYIAHKQPPCVKIYETNKIFGAA